MGNTWNFTPTTDTSINKYNTMISVIGNTAIAEKDNIWINPMIYSSLHEIAKKRNHAQENGPVKFRKVDLDTIDIINSFISHSEERTVDFSLGGIYMWKDYFNYEFAVYENLLIIKGTDPLSGKSFIQLPLTNRCFDNKKILESLKLKFSEAGVVVNSVLRFKEIANENQSIGSQMIQEEYSFGKEYIYPLEQFLSFKGRKMEKKRNHLNYFMKNYPDHTVEAISTENINSLIDFTHRLHENDEMTPLAQYELNQTIDALRYYMDFPYLGILIRDSKGIVGFSFGEAVGDTFFVHVEKADVTYHGAYQALASILANRVAENHPYVRFLNREEDMGDESLIKSKESYHPSSYIVKRYYDL